MTESVDIDEIEWHLSLIMSGEERILKNMEGHSKTIPLYFEDEYGRDFCDCGEIIWKSCVDKYVRRSNQMETVDNITEKLDDKDRRILELNYVHEEKEDVIA